MFHNDLRPLHERDSTPSPLESEIFPRKRNTAAKDLRIQVYTRRQAKPKVGKFLFRDKIRPMSNQPIELNRHFSFDSGQGKNHEHGDSATRARGQREATWDDLLQIPRVIILAEAGMGKTAELERKELTLRAMGKHAFRCLAGAVARENDFRKAFTDPEYAKRFDRWLGGNAVGYFLIDALDEANVSAVEDVFRPLGHALAAALGRSRVYVASRASEWHDERYFGAFRKSLKFPPIKPGSIAGVGLNAYRIAHLEPLSCGQQKRLATTQFNVRGAGKMLNEAVRIVGEPAVNRPLDLRATSRYWLQHKKIGSRMDMMKNFVNINLGEWDTGRKQKKKLSPSKAQEGAEFLAAAKALCGGGDGIQVGDSSADAMNAREALPKEWGDDKITALLDLPIFGSQSPGVVKFHHREARDYLVASWFKRMLDGEASPSLILPAFEAAKYGESFVYPVMRPIAAWLAQMENGKGEFSTRMRELEPVTLMTHGDPSALSLEFRRNVLRAAAKKIADNREAENIYNISLDRFEYAGTANVVNELLGTFNDNPEVVKFLLRIVEKGKIAECADKALDIALNKSTMEKVRYSAIYAVPDASAQHAKKLAEATVAQADKWTGGDLARAMSRLFPKSMDIGQFIQCIEKKAGIWGKWRDDSYLLEHISLEEMTHEQLREFLNGILATVKAREERVGRRAESLTATLTAKALMPLLAPSNAPHEDEEILCAIEALGKYRGRRFSEWNNVVKKTSANWRLVYALCWRAFQRESPIEWDVFDMSKLSDSPELLQAFLSDIRTQSNVKKREKVLHIIYRIWRPGALENSDVLAEIRAALASDAEMSEKLEKSLEQSAKWGRRWKREETVRFGREQKEQKAKENNLREFIGHIQKMSTRLCSFDAKAPPPPDVVESLLDLHNWMLGNQPKSANNSDSGPCRWESMIPVFGEEVARCARDGMMKFWRTYTPAPISEVRGGRNSWNTDMRVSLGSLGLDMLHQQQREWMDELTADDAARAARYATHSSNQFPDWFPALAFKHQEAVGKIMRSEMEKDIRQSADNAFPNILPAMLHSNKTLENFFALMALDILGENPTIGKNARHDVSRLLRSLKYGKPAERKIDFYCRRIDETDDIDEQSFWLAEWMRTDASTAIKELECHLQNASNLDDAKKFMINFCGRFGNETRAHNTQGLREMGLWGNIGLLLKMLRLTLAHVRYEDDNRHDGAYTPDTRDHAQDFRGTLFNHLVSECSGEEAYRAMMKLSAETVLDEHTRGVLRIYARRCAENDAKSESFAWDPAEIVGFANDMTPPLRDPNKFFQWFLYVLNKLKSGWEGGNFSPKDQIHNEEDAQILAAHGMEFMGEGKFSVTREDVVIERRERDIRIQPDGGGSVVSVEMKIADNWSFRQLHDALKEQLPQYLRAPDARHGILLLVYKGEKKWRIDSHLADFNKLTSALDNQAKELAGKIEDVDDIRVIGVDLSQAKKKTGTAKN